VRNSAAPILDSAGSYGVVSFGAARGTHEIGLRMAQAAARGDILKLIFRDGLVGSGVLVGLLAALALTRAMSKLWMGVSPSDPVTYLGLIILLGAVSLLACWIPGRRATNSIPSLLCSTNGARVIGCHQPARFRMADYPRRAFQSR